jgi:predicted DNA-binding transcriptional regulator YafY
MRNAAKETEFRSLGRVHFSVNPARREVVLPKGVRKFLHERETRKRKIEEKEEKVEKGTSPERSAAADCLSPGRNQAGTARAAAQGGSILERKLQGQLNLPRRQCHQNLIKRWGAYVAVGQPKVCVVQEIEKLSTKL